MERSQGSLGIWTGLATWMFVQWPRFGIETIPPPQLSSGRQSTLGTPRRWDPVEVPQGMFRGRSASSRGGGLASSAYERVNSGGVSSLCLGTRANSSGCTASFGSADGGSLGMGTLVTSSTLVVSNGALSVEAEATESALVTFDMLRWNWLPLSTRITRHQWSCWMALQSTPWVYQHEQHSTGGPLLVSQFPPTSQPNNHKSPGNHLVEGSLFSPMLTSGKEQSMSCLLPVGQLAA